MQSKNILTKTLKLSVRFDVNLELHDIWIADKTRPEIYSHELFSQSWNIRTVEHRSK